MNKSILMSVRPEHLINILNGKKTLELRKTVPKDFVGWVYIYCTHTPKHHHVYDLTYVNNGVRFYSVVHHNKRSFVPEGYLNGKVVARFWFDTFSIIDPNITDYYGGCISSTTYDANNPSEYEKQWGEQSGYWDIKQVENYTKLSLEEMKDYSKGKDLYAWHIKQLEIFDTPLSLNDFYKATLYASGQVIKEYEKQTNDFSYRLQKAPQSWRYVYVEELENDK